MPAHPAIAISCASVLAAQAAGCSPHVDLPALALEQPDLLKRFAKVSDGRSDQGRDHPVAAVLTLCAAAVLGGMRSFTAIAGWVADVPGEVLARLYGAPQVIFPSKTTLWRVLTGADPAAVDAAVGAWLAEQAACTTSAPETPAGAPAPGLVAVAVDGKTLRGAVDSEGNQTHLLAAATHGEQLVLGQVEVGAKTNEIPMFAPLIDRLAAIGVDLSQLVITADALHCQRAHAEYLHERGANFVLTAKHNQPGLFAALDALPWAETPSPTARSTTTTAGSPPAPSRSGPPPTTCRSPTSTRPGWLNATSTTTPAPCSPRSPRSESPA